MIACVAPEAAGRRDTPIHTIGTILGHIHSSKGCRQVKSFAQRFFSGSHSILNVTLRR